MIHIGAYGRLTLDEARKKAKLLYGHVVEGKDPMEERKHEALSPTMDGLCNDYLERHVKVHKQKSLRDDLRRIEKAILPIWGHRPVKSITREDVSELHRKIGEHAPYEANRTLAQLSKMFELAKTWGYLEEAAPNPARRIQKFKEKKRDRWVTPEELPKLAEQIDQEKNIYIRAALWLYLLTGVRKTELLTAKWEDIDEVRRTLRLPETKAGRIHYVPLSAEAMSILAQIPRQENNPYVLPGMIEGQHLVNVEKSWQRVRKEAGVADVRLHDLRRTVGSWLAQSGNSLMVIQKALNHSTMSATLIYARMSEDPVRKALDEHGKQLMAAAGKSEGGKLIELTQKAEP